MSRRWSLCHVTIAAHHLDPATFRAALRKAKSRIADCQRRAGMASFYVEVIEAERTPHAHLLVAVNQKARRLLGKLATSKTFAKLDDGANTFIRVDSVYDIDGLLGYLSAEKSGWAQRVTGGTRRKVEKTTGQRLGDRVRLSKDLEAALLAAGAVKPHQRTYAKATAPKLPKLKAADRRSTVTGTRDADTTADSADTPMAEVAPKRRGRPSNAELRRRDDARRIDEADRHRTARRVLGTHASADDIEAYIAFEDMFDPGGHWSPWRLGLIPGYKPPETVLAAA